MTVAMDRAASSTEWGWRSGPCAALDHRFELRVEPAAEFTPVLGPIVAPFRRAAGEPSHVDSVYEVRLDRDGRLPYAMTFDGERVAGARYADEMVGTFTWHINRTVISRTVPHRVLLHAAAATRAGMTVILPAGEEHGKTTTVAGLLRAGYDYVTDEAVAIDPASGWITPFPKTLSIDPGSWDLFPECAPVSEHKLRQWQVPAARLGARIERDLVPPPQLIVFPRYQAGARTRLSPMTRGEAVRELSQMCFLFQGYAGRNLAVLADLAAAATVARLVIGSLDEAVDAIDGLVSERLRGLL